MEEDAGFQRKGRVVPGAIILFRYNIAVVVKYYCSHIMLLGVSLTLRCTSRDLTLRSKMDCHELLDKGSRISMGEWRVLLCSRLDRGTADG